MSTTTPQLTRIYSSIGVRARGLPQELWDQIEPDIIEWLGHHVSDIFDDHWDTPESRWGIMNSTLRRLNRATYSQSVSTAFEEFTIRSERHIKKFMECIKSASQATAEHRRRFVNPFTHFTHTVNMTAVPNLQQCTFADYVQSLPFRLSSNQLSEKDANTTSDYQQVGSQLATTDERTTYCGENQPPKFTLNIKAGECHWKLDTTGYVPNPNPWTPWPKPPIERWWNLFNLNDGSHICIDTSGGLSRVGAYKSLNHQYWSQALANLSSLIEKANSGASTMCVHGNGSFWLFSTPRTAFQPGFSEHEPSDNSYNQTTGVTFIIDEHDLYASNELEWSARLLSTGLHDLLVRLYLQQTATAGTISGDPHSFDRESESPTHQVIKLVLTGEMGGKLSALEQSLDEVMLEWRNILHISTAKEMSSCAAGRDTAKKRRAIT